METKWRWIFVAAIAPIAWGSTYFVTRQLLPADVPLWGAVIRALPAGLILLLIARKLPHGSWWWKSVVLGFLNVGAFFILVYVAAQLLPSSIASTLMALAALVMALLAWPLLGERPRLVSIAGAVIGIAGVCIMLLSDVTALSPWGILASLAAMIMSSVGFILAKKWGAGVDPLALTSWQLIAGAALVLPVAALVEGAPPALEPPAILGFLYVTIVATAVANVAWLVALRNLPVASVGIIGLLNPVTGVALGVILASEAFGWRQLIGVALVLGGVLLAQRQRTKPPRLKMEGYVPARDPDRDHLPA
ncbi:EamA family transporter [Glaciihabitans arcticus]|uniref:EamA family transporter n=1 Tax=Glaciihabitans arcticus TaxID=2668039 RepID=A0A4Q9GWC3_9MICO|nr:EamA family transporter [Glaciihabitans arcticus]TBN57507.1 EamA family transporter [Glaciihabitans arcticus]